MKVPFPEHSFFDCAWRLSLSQQMTLLICLFLLSVPALSAQKSDSRADSPPPMSAGNGCVMVASLNLLELQKNAPAKARQQVPRRTPEKELRQPMTERELRLLLRAMEPVEIEKGKGQAPRAFVEGTELALDRMGVLLGDVFTVLADLHARDTLDQLAGMRALKPEARVWWEKALNGIRGCAPDQFAERGGTPVFAQTLELVERFRPELENMLLESLRSRIFFSPLPGGTR